MDEDEVLRCLAEAESGRLRPELCGGRYAAVADAGTWGEDAEDAFWVDEDAGNAFSDDESDADESDADEDDAHEELAQPRVLGEAGSLYEAFDLLVTAAIGDADPAEQLRAAGLAARVGGGTTPLRSGPTSPARRYFAHTVLPSTASMQLMTSGHHPAFAAPALFDGARFCFLSSAAPPHADEMWAILELQPTGETSEVQQDLLAAAARGDTDAVAAALAAGADVNALDERGMTALHAAVAHRHPGAVTALLAAGADPARQAAFGNAPQFAGLDHRQRVSACADRIDDDEHAAIVRAVLDAGAPLDAANRVGATLLDLALDSASGADGLVAALLARGARSGALHGRSLGHLLTRLPSRDPRAQWTRVNQVRYLLDTGSDPNAVDDSPFRQQGPGLYALLGHTTYHAHEVPGEVLLALVDELLRHGARDAPCDGRTALEEVVTELHDERFHHYRPVADRLRAAAASEQGTP